MFRVRSFFLVEVEVFPNPGGVVTFPALKCVVIRSRFLFLSDGERHFVVLCGHMVFEDAELSNAFGFHGWTQRSI